MPSVRFIRFAKLVALIADIWTLACAMLVGWQTVIFLREGNWQALPLSLVFSTPKNTDVRSTRRLASINQ